MTGTIRFFHHEDDRTGTNYYGNAVIVDEMPKIGEEYDSAIVMELGLRSWFAEKDQNAYNIYEVKGPEVPLYKLRDGVDPKTIFGDKQPRCIMDEEIDNLGEKLGRPELYKDFEAASYADIVEMGFDPFLITSRFVAVLSDPDLPTNLGELTEGQETGIMLIRNNSNAGRWEAFVGNWYSAWQDETVTVNGEELSLDAPHKELEIENLGEYLTNKDGEPWFSVEDDEDDDLPKLLADHMAGKVYDYGDLQIVCPEMWN